MTDIPVTIKLRADGKGLTGTLNATQRQLLGLEGQLDRTGRSTNRFSRQTQSARQRLSGLAVAARAAFAALAVRQVAGMADEMAMLNSRLRLVVDSQEQYNRAQADVFAIAQQNGRALGAVGELYTRLAQSSKTLREDQDALNTITTAVTQSMRVSGTSASESAGAIRQLSQAFASGVLRGDEFNSVNEQAPRLMQALADNLRVTRGELRGMAEDGELTSEILQRALIDQAAAIAEESARIPQTMAEGVTQVQNQLLNLVAVLDQATGGSGSVAGFLGRIASAVGEAAAFIEANYLNIQLAGIAMVRGLMLAFEELRGGFELLQRLATESFARLNNAFQTTIAGSADLIASYIEMNANAVDLVPGLGDMADKQRLLAAGFRAAAVEARGNKVETQQLGDIYAEVRDEVDAAKDQVREITDDMADYAISTGNVARANGEFTASQNDANTATEEAIKLTKKQIEARESMDDAIADLAAKLRGPLQVAMREFQRDAQGVAQQLNRNDISYQQAIDMLDLLEQQFIQTRDEIGNRLARTLEDLAFNSLPAVIQQMLGLADATKKVARESGALSQIGSNFAQSVINGQGAGSALQSSLLSFGGQGIGEALDATDMTEFFKKTFTDGIGAAFEDSEFQKNSAAGYALALNQAVAGNYGQAAFTAAGNALGGELGALIGSILGDLAFGESVPKFQVRGRNAQQATDAGTDRVINTAFGAELELAFRGIEDQAKSQIVRGYSEFLTALSGVIRAPGQQADVAEAIARFGVSSRSGPDDLEGQLNLLFDEILLEFDSFTQQFVNMAETLEERVQRLSEVFFIQNQLLLGRGFGLDGVAAGAGAGFGGGAGGGAGGGQPGVPVDPGGAGGGISPDPGFARPKGAETIAKAIATIDDGAEDLATTVAGLSPELRATLLLLDDLRIGGEALQDTFARLSSVTADLDRAAGLTGNQFADSREGLVRFGAELVAIFGDDAGAFSGMMNRVLEAAFSDEELAQQTIDAARQRATDLLTGLGIAVTEETFTQGGLRDLLDNYLGNLGPEQTAQLLAAGDAIATLLGAVTELGDSAEVAAAEMSDSAEIILRTFAPARLEFARLSQQIDELRSAEQDLGFARLAAEIQLQGFIVGLEQSLPGLIAQLNGAGSEAAAATEQITRGVVNTRDAWLSAIDSIQDALNSQLTGSNSSLNNRQKLDESERQLAAAVQAANAGDLGAAQQVAGLFNQTIAQGAGFYGTSTDQFAEFEARIRELAGSVPTNATIPPEITTAQNTGEIARSSRQIEQTQLDQFQIALQALDVIGLLAMLTPQSAAEIAQANNADIKQLIGILTGEVPDLTGDALASYFNELVAETNQQMNELAALENIGQSQLGAQLTLVDLMRELLGYSRDMAEKITQSAGATQEGSGTINGPATMPGDGSVTALATGGIVRRPTVALIGEAGPEAVLPLTGNGGIGGLEKRLAKIEGALLVGNSDRRTAAELTVTEAAAVRRLLARQTREARINEMRPDKKMRRAAS